MKTTNSFRAFLVLVTAAIACCWMSWYGASSFAEEARTWSDKSGKFKIKATFKSLENGTVVLEQEDGSELEIELKKLSAADQEYANQAAEGDNPFKKKSDDPFKPKAKKKKPPAEDADEPDVGESQSITVDWTSAESIVLGATTEWKVTVAAPSDAFAAKPKAAALPNKSNFFEGIKGLAISRAAKKAAVGFIVGGPKPEGSRVVLCDLATGKSTPPATGDGQMAPLALHDDGKQILMRREEIGYGNQDRLEVWLLKGKKTVKTLEWTPYDSDQGAPRDVMWAEFLDPDHLATSSRGGKVAIWKYPEIELECTFSTADGAVPSLSPDRSIIAYCTGDQMGLFDVAKREVVAQQPIPEKLQWPFLAFSPSGKRLGCIAFDKVVVWDVASGKLERTIPCPGLLIHGAIDYPSDGFILANNQFLIDVENQLKLWTYTGHEQVRSAGGWTFFGVTNGEQSPGALVPVQLPQPAASDLLKKALTDPNLFVFKAGTTVKLDTSGIPDPAQRDSVQQALTKRLQELGCQTGPAGTIDLLASVEGPKDRDVSYFGSGDYKTKEYLTRVRFMYQGQPVWETAGTNVPFIISLKEGENVEGYLRAHEKPEYGFFDSVQLPKFLQKPAAGQQAGNSLTLGQSQVTTSGLK